MARAVWVSDIGPAAAMPVMEKAVLFKQFANVDARPVALDTKDAKNHPDRQRWLGLRQYNLKIFLLHGALK